MQATDQASSSASTGRTVLRSSVAVAALIGVGLLGARITPGHMPGASVADEFAVYVVQQDYVPTMAASRSAVLPISVAPDEVAKPPRYQGEPATY